MRKAFVISILILLCAVQVFSQKKTSLEIIPVDKPIEFFKKAYAVKSKVNSLPSAQKALGDLVSELQRDGYLAASIDSITEKEGIYSATIFVGDKYEWLQLRNGNVEPSLLDQVGYKEKLFAGAPIYYQEVKQLEGKLLEWCENHGYPFARVWLDSFALQENKMSAGIYLQKNERIVFDTLRIYGDSKIKPKFLMAYLGLKKGNPYNESIIQKISTRISELPYLQETQPAIVDFLNDKATVRLHLEDGRNSQFNFLVGFLPSNTQTGGLLVTGEAKLHLISPFGTGKEILVDWQKLQPRTQNLELGFKYPYILNFPMGVDLSFKLDKIDSFFINLDAQYGIQYQIIGDNYIKIFGRNALSNVLFYDTTSIILQKRLPQNLDYTFNSLGLEYKFDRRNYRLNPTSGYLLKLDGAAGAKKIKKNVQVTNLIDPVLEESFEYLYDSIRLKTVIADLGLRFDYFIPIKKRSTVKLGVDSRFKIGKEILFNEKYRIGGINSLRGFDEESIYTPYYSIFTTEYRFLLSKNSYFYSFFDLGIVEDSRFGGGHIDTPFGFGAGVALETKAGIFAVSYALGKQLDNNIEFRSAKIHFGYVNYF